MVRWSWVNIQCRGVMAGQGPTAPAVGADAVGWTFLLIYLFSLLSPFPWETARYRLKYCLKGP